MTGDAHAGMTRRRRWRITVAGVLIAALSGAVARVGFEATRTVFPLKEIPTPEDWNFASATAVCRGPSPDVKRYPALTSANAVYGRLSFNGTDGRPLKPPIECCFAIDESASKGRGYRYDTFYLDADRNLDLSDDRPVKGRFSTASPTGVWQFVFDPVSIKGAGEGGTDVLVSPRLQIGQPPSVGFVSPTARQGRIRIAGRSYTATFVRYDLRNPRYGGLAHVRLSRPERSIKIRARRLFVFSEAEDRTEMVSAIFTVHGVWCSLSVTPAGDAVTVSTVKDVGAVKVSFKGRTDGNALEDASFRDIRGNRVHFTAPPGRYDDVVTLPVGDYTFNGGFCMHVGSVSIVASENSPSARGVHDGGQPLIKVRKDSPAVIEFPSSAEIVWAGLEDNRIYRPGDTLEPRLLIRAGRFDVENTDFMPRVMLRDSAGSTIAAGPDSDGELEIPARFVPEGGRETLPLTADWDTRSLFGKLKSARDIVVESTATAR